MKEEVFTPEEWKALLKFYKFELEERRSLTTMEEDIQRARIGSATGQDDFRRMVATINLHWKERADYREGMGEAAAALRQLTGVVGLPPLALATILPALQRVTQTLNRYRSEEDHLIQPEPTDEEVREALEAYFQSGG
jgi:hypothetical protein